MLGHDALFWQKKAYFVEMRNDNIPYSNTSLWFRLKFNVLLVFLRTIMLSTKHEISTAL